MLVNAAPAVALAVAGLVAAALFLWSSLVESFLKYRGGPVRSLLASHALRIVLLAGNRGQCKNTVSAPSPSPQTKPRTISGPLEQSNQRTRRTAFQLSSFAALRSRIRHPRTAFPLREEVIYVRYAVNTKGQETPCTIALSLHVLIPEQSCLLLYSLSLVPAAIHFITSYIYTHYAI